MARYIEASELEKGMYENPSDEYERGWNNALEGAMLAIKPANVVEVRTAYWEGAGLGDYICSLCWGQFSGGNRFAYCPECGAKMLNKEEDSLCT